MTDAELLTVLSLTAFNLTEAQAYAAEHKRRRDELIGQALDRSISPAAIAAAAEITTGRLYQIRDAR